MICKLDISLKYQKMRICQKPETLWLSKNKTTELYENSFKNLKLGKRYYVRISYYYVDEYGEEDLKLLCPKWYLKQAVDIVR